MKLLFHLCCGPCGTAPIRELRRDGVEVTGLYYNPNVHPSMENFHRREAAYLLARSMGFPMAETPDYEYREFFRAVVGREDERCPICYRMRLDRTAAAAVAGGFDAFSTSLLVSPFQKHEIIKEVAETVADERGVTLVTLCSCCSLVR